MIEYIKGEIAELSPASATIDCNGLGYAVNISLNTYAAIQGKKSCKLQTAVNSFTALSDLLRDYAPGDQVTLTIFRANQSYGSSRYGYSYGGQTIQGSTFEVTVTLMEDTGAAASAELQNNSTQG